MICQLKPDLDCPVTPDLADDGGCICPEFVHYDPRNDRNDSPMLMVDEEVTA